MIPIIHKVNNLEKLESVPKNYGIEIDIRSFQNKLVLAHDLSENLTDFEDFIKEVDHKLVVANIKETGIETSVIKSFEKNKINNFFLLDVEFPYLLENYKSVGKNLSLRYSKFESVSSSYIFNNFVDWVWVDTYDEFELNNETIDFLKNYKICLVSPSRWGKEEDLKLYIDKLENEKIHISAVMINQGEELDITEC